MSTDQLIERMNLILKRVNEVINDNQTLRHEVEELRAELASQKKVNAIQKNSLETLEQKNNLSNIAMGVSLMSEKEKQAVKSTISQQIREIDQCLKLLKS